MKPMKPSTDNNLGSFTRRHRTALGLSMRALAEKTGFTAAYISDIENQKRIPNRPDTLNRLAEGLKRSYAELSEIVAQQRDRQGNLAKDVPQEQLALARRIATSRLTDEQIERIRSAIETGRGAEC